MAKGMTYVQMISKALEEAKGGKYMSRAAIKNYLVQNLGQTESATFKNAVKKALMKFERKGDSFRISQEMKQAESSKAKASEKRAKAAARKSQMAQKKKAKAAALKERRTARKAALKVKADAKKAKKAAAKAKKATKKKGGKKKSAAKKTKKASKKKAKAGKKSAKKSWQRQEEVSSQEGQKGLNGSDSWC